MKFRTRTILQISLLIILAGTFFAGSIFTNRSIQNRESRKPVLSGFEPDSIGKVVFQKSGVGTELFKEPAGTWKIKVSGEEYPVSSERISGFLLDLKQQQTLRTVSRNETNWKTFGVDSPDTDDYIYLESSERNRNWKLIVGTVSSGGNTAFVRNSTRSEVYETGYSLRKYIDERPTYWQNLRLFPADLKESGINGIILKADIVIRNGESSDRLNEEYSLAKLSEGNSTSWKIIGKDMKIDQKEVAELVRNLSQLEAAEFLPGTGIEKPQAEVIVSTDSGRRFRLLFGEVGGDNYPVLVEGSKYMYSVSQWRVNAVLRTLSSLLEKS